MRIEGQPPIQRAMAAKAAGAKRADSFAAMVGGAQNAAAGMSAPVGLVGSVFALDGDADAANGRSRGLASAHDLLDELESLRRALLLGSVSSGRLAQIADKLDRLPVDSDDALCAIVDDIRLRVAVEIAKLSPAHLVACRSLSGLV